MGKDDKKRIFGGIDIGGTKILAVVAEEGGKILGSAKKKTKREQGFKGVCARAAESLREAAEAAKVPMEALCAAGMGVPTPVLADGTTAIAPNMPGWKNAPFTKTMAELLGIPCYGVNDCNAAALGEYVYGAGKGSKTLVGLFVGTGLGGGMVFHDHVIEGENHVAAELGHIIVREGGRKCGCGHNGCLEAYASKTGMGRKIAWDIHHQGRKSVLTQCCPDGNYATIKSSDLLNAWKQGDEVTVEALKELSYFLGIGVANFITILGPDSVVLGGGVMEALGKDLLPLVKEAARKYTWPESSYKDSKISLSLLGDNAPTLGTVAFARQRLDNEIA